MEFERIKKYLQKEEEEEEDDEHTKLDQLPFRFFDPFIISTIQEEIEIEAKKVRVGKAIAVVSVEFRKKATGKIIAQGRHTKYLPVKSNL